MCSIIGQRERLRKVFGQIRLELWLSWQHIAPIDLTWEKLCHHRSGFIFSLIGFILTDNEDGHKISIKFDFGLNRIIHLGVTCPWAFENLPVDLTWGDFCHHCSCFNFFQIGFILANDQTGQEISVKFDYWQNRIIHSGVTCPCLGVTCPCLFLH